MHFTHPLTSHLVGWATFVLLALCGSANLYYLFCIFAAKDCFRRAAPLDRGFHPPLSVLKPIRGLDPDAVRSLSSFCRQDYPDYELILGVEDADDPAINVVGEIIRAFPEIIIRHQCNHEENTDFGRHADALPIHESTMRVSTGRSVSHPQCVLERGSFCWPRVRVPDLPQTLVEWLFTFEARRDAARLDTAA